MNGELPVTSDATQRWQCTGCGQPMSSAYCTGQLRLCRTCFWDPLRDRSVVDQEPHKLPVVGSIPAPATNLVPAFNGTAASTVLVGTWTAWLTRWAGQFFCQQRNHRAHRLGFLLGISPSLRRVA